MKKILCKSKNHEGKKRWHSPHSAMHCNNNEPVCFMGARCWGNKLRGPLEDQTPVKVALEAQVVEDKVE